MSISIHSEGIILSLEVQEKARHSRNEEQLRHEVEQLLETACRRLGITWTPYQLERPLKRGRGKSYRFADVVHGAVVIEYEPPQSFSGREGANLQHARAQAEEYTTLVQAEEGRPIDQFVLVAWDGAHINFGHHDGDTYVWDPLEAFNVDAAKRLLGYLRDNGVPLVHPLLLAERVGPTSHVGATLLPAFFDAVQASEVLGQTNKTTLLYTEWRRLFGQVTGDHSDRLKKHLADISQAHGRDYAEDTSAYMFSLNTYIALVAKLVAALALPSASEDISNSQVPIADRIDELESGRLFRDAGITNMLNGDFFSWYMDDSHWNTFEASLHDLVNTLGGISFNVTRKTPESTRDLFKGLYMTFTPEALRHALGEYYTPDWLAAHAMDTVQWKETQSLLDPTCGSGTFILEGLRRRLLADIKQESTAAQLIEGLYGFDLNPLAVLSARASLVVFIGHRLDTENPLQLPIYLADAVNPAESYDGFFEHSLQTEKGVKTFRLPEALVSDSSYFQLMNRLRHLIDRDLSAADIMKALGREAAIQALTTDGVAAVGESVSTLVDLHLAGWNGIWSSVLADRFAAGAVPKVDAVIGNPPWVKWSHLPEEYAEFIKPHCEALGIFSTDSWVGGIESDISTVITYKSIVRYCKHGGSLAFLITGTVFANESSQGFRRWRIQSVDQHEDGSPVPDEQLTVELVEDYAAVAPFEGVKNHPTLLVIRREQQETCYPVPYRVWQPPYERNVPKRSFSDSQAFRSEAHHTDLLALPVPGSDAGPWLKGTRAQHDVWTHLFGRRITQAFKGRKGVTTDANGIYFVVTEATNTSDIVKVTNDPKLGRRSLPQVSARIEAKHVYPLLRGAGIQPFKAVPEKNHCVIVPQDGMFGDPDLPTTAPKTFDFLNRFESTLTKRSSYKLYQKGKPFWSIWSTGAYTFKPYKVVWKEMSGGRFQAAYVDSYAHPALGNKVVVPDHKVYFAPCETEDEAAYLTGFLNAPLVAGGVNAYASALSLGTSVVEYLHIPPYDSSNSDHVALSSLAKRLTKSDLPPSDQEWVTLDRLAGAVSEITQDVLQQLHAEAEEATEAVEIAQVHPGEEIK